MEQSKPRSEVRQSELVAGYWRIYIGGNDWTAEAATWSTSGEVELSDLSARGNDVDSLLDFLSTLFPTSYAIAERRTCSKPAYPSGKLPTPSE